MIRAKINGKESEFEDGISILKAAQSLGIDVPTLCHDDRLKPVGACRLCLVDIKGEAREVSSCTRALADGMEIETHTAEIERSRAMNLRMLAKDYPLEALKQFPDKHFHQLAAQYGLTDADFSTQTVSKFDDSHAYINSEMSRCVHCNACVRICDEVQGQFVWNVLGRGANSLMSPDSFGKFGESEDCVSCGACADACPTGALDDRSVYKYGTATDWTKTVCPYCGVGCEMEVGTRNDRIVQIKPSKESPVNRGHLCVKGRYAFEFVHSPTRITSPMIKRDGEWQAVSWEEVNQYLATELRQIIDANGNGSVAVLGSARATNEENYIAQKFARVCLETNNVDCCARVCHTPSAAALKMMLGTGAATNSFEDAEKARTFLVSGANPTENHPIIGARVKQAVLKGANLIVVDPRKTEIAKYATVHLQIQPGTNIPLYNSIAHAIIDEGLADEEFIADRVTEFEEYRDFVKDFAPEKVAEICGVSAEDIRKAARLYATAKPAMSMHGLGMTEHTQGTEGVMCLVNLALLTGNMGKPGSGVNPLRGQNNVQGSAQMGCDPGNLTGIIPLNDGRELFESVWQAPVPSDKGLNVLQMIDGAAKGKVKALWAIGYDVFLSLSDSNYIEKALDNLELCIVQDLFFNETARRFANVVLPAASSFEKDGTFMNAERRVQRIRKAIEPIGESHTDWQILCDVAAAMGKGEFFAYENAEDIWNEIRAVWSNSFGITYERIEKQGLQWNCPTLEHDGTGVLHSEEFPVGVKTPLRKIKYIPTKEITSDDFPFILNSGRSLYHFNAATMTGLTNNNQLRPTDTLDIAPADASSLEISDGDQVRIRSAYGEAVLPANVTSAVNAGELFATFHVPELFLNRVTSSHRDRFVQAPEYKVTAVKLEKL